jgi:hypothetical protein
MAEHLLHTHDVGGLCHHYSGTANIAQTKKHLVNTVYFLRCLFTHRTSMGSFRFQELHSLKLIQSCGIECDCQNGGQIRVNAGSLRTWKCPTLWLPHTHWVMRDWLGMCLERQTASVADPFVSHNIPGSCVSLLQWVKFNPLKTKRICFI